MFCCHARNAQECAGGIYNYVECHYLPNQIPGYERAPCLEGGSASIRCTITGLASGAKDAMVFYHPRSAADLDIGGPFFLCPHELLHQPLNDALKMCIRLNFEVPLSRNNFAHCMAKQYVAVPSCTGLRGVAAVPKVPPTDLFHLHPGASSPSGCILPDDVVLVHPDSYVRFLPPVPVAAGEPEVKDLWLVIGAPVCLVR